jgi:hypothetical protein
MSKVKIQCNASGTGVLTIEAPNTNTDRTITLPDSTGTVLMTDGDGSNLTGTADATKLPLTGGTMTGALNITASGTGMTFNTPSSSQNNWVTWKDSGTNKWEIGKNTVNDLYIHSYTLGSAALILKEDGRGLSQFTAKAWVNFNGAGTVAIRDSHNVSSVTDNGTGDYTVNMTNALSNSDYCVVKYNNAHSSSTSAGAFNNNYTGGLWANSTSTFSITSYNVGLVDSTLVTAIVFGDSYENNIPNNRRTSSTCTSP